MSRSSPAQPTNHLGRDVPNRLVLNMPRRSRRCDHSRWQRQSRSRKASVRRRRRPPLRGRLRPRLVRPCGGQVVRRNYWIHRRADALEYDSRRSPDQPMGSNPAEDSAPRWRSARPTRLDGLGYSRQASGSTVWRRSVRAKAEEFCERLPRFTRCARQERTRSYLLECRPVAQLKALRRRGKCREDTLTS
jgi:hypothetical protein